MRKLKKLTLRLAAVFAAVLGSVVAAASACSGEFARFYSSPGITDKVTLGVLRIATFVKWVLKTLRGPLLGVTCYIARPSRGQIKVASENRPNGLTGLAENTELSMGRVGRNCGDGGEEVRHVTPVAVHGHCFA
jgi:hypothetical protein